MDKQWINIHTHKPGKGINVIDSCLGETLAPTDGKRFYSLGIHPGFIDDKAEQRLEEIGLAAKEKRIVAVGEAGLDRNVAVDMVRQQELFECQVGIAVEYDLPLIIHCVRAVPELLTIRKKNGSYRKWVMHGFNNRQEVLADLLRHGFYISVGRHVMNETSQIYGLLPEIPLERLFIETDNSDYEIEEIYRQVAKRRGMEMNELQQAIAVNFCKLFHV